MKRHFHEQINELRQSLLKMGCLAEEALGKAVDAFVKRDSKLAKEVIEKDKEIDNQEIQIDDAGHGLLVLGQPMAQDMRFITMALKIDTDLERIGDHAVNIAEKGLYLIEEPPLNKELQFPEMARAAQEMLHHALEAFVKEDVSIARSVLKSDDVVDTYHRALCDSLCEYAAKDPAKMKVAINLIMISHNLERVADLASNIAEDVIYLKLGKEVRHHSEKK